MIRVTASSHYLESVADTSSPPVLDEALKACCREVPRRVDRFIQLALLGSARCVTGHELRPDCALYLGSGLGPIGNTIVTQEQLVRDREPPKPFNFINTLGSSAGFYVARNLGLGGQNWFVSRRGASLEAALATAWRDLTSGRIAQALVGIVEEVPWPPAAHRRRLGLSADAPLAEGSHWLLLERDAMTGRMLHEERCTDFDALRDALDAGARNGDELWCAASLPASAVAQLHQKFTTAENTVVHDSPAAAWLTGRLATSFPGRLRLAGGNDVVGWTVWCVGNDEC